MIPKANDWDETTESDRERERERVGEGVGENERKDARVNDTYR